MKIQIIGYKDVTVKFFSVPGKIAKVSQFFEIFTAICQTKSLQPSKILLFNRITLCIINKNVLNVLKFFDLSKSQGLSVL